MVYKKQIELGKSVFFVEWTGAWPTVQFLRKFVCATFHKCVDNLSGLVRTGAVVEMHNKKSTASPPVGWKSHGVEIPWEGNPMGTKSSEVKLP